VIRGEKPIELGNSWFSAKTIEVVRHDLLLAFDIGLTNGI